MKKYIITSVLVMILMILSSIDAVHATVGGSTVVYDLKYDAKTESIYYTEQNNGGKGCPPELKAISINTNTSKVIFSCDSGYDDQSEKIETFTSTFSTLIPIDLKKNNIDLTIDATNYEKVDNSSWIIRIDFIARIFQGEIKLAEIPISGCSTEQPFIVDGYRIPGKQDRLILLFSAKSDCFEGGYIGESLSVVSGVSLNDISQINTYKTVYPLIPHEGSLVIYRTRSLGDQPTDLSVQKSINADSKNYSVIVLIGFAVLIFVVGLVIGRLIKIPIYP